jgi:serine/threonine-protein kinase
MARDDEAEIPTLDAPPIFAGRWRLEGMIGAGGMGAVYRARDLELDEVVALKVLTDVDAASLGRFREEVRLARKVTHRNVARTYDIGEHEGRRFLTMEHVQGPSLRSVMQRGPFSKNRARDVARQICAGVAAVHAEGIAHGDLKPENVLVTESGELKVSDFGLATVIERGEGGMVGTPVYMAPEQIEGGPPDRRTDVYALGVILHELFAGRRPWSGDTNDIMARKLVESVPPIAEELPGDVHALVIRCLSRDARTRPESAEEIFDALDGDPLALTGGRSALRGPARPDVALRVAVKTLTGESADDQYLAVALTSDLARILGTATELEVHAAPNADCDAWIEGTVRRVGMSIRMGLRLFSTRDRYLLWGRGQTVPIADALEAIESAARAIAETLSAKTVERARLPITSNPKLLDLYLRARHAEQLSWESFGTNECDLYEELLAASPDDPLVLAGYASALTRRGGLVPGSHSKSREAAERALLLAPDLPEAHLAVALVLFTANAHEGAARAAIHAAERSPSLASAHSVIGNLLCEVGRLDEGLARIDLALAIEPRLTIAWSTGVLHRARSGRDVEPGLTRAPTSMLPTAHWLYWLTRMRVALHRGEEELKRIAGGLSATPFGQMPPLATLVKLADRSATAAEIAAGVAPLIGGEESAARPRALGLSIVAEAAAFLGDDDTLKKTLVAIDATSFIDRTWFDGGPLFERHRREPWFVDIRDRVAARAQKIEIAFP